MWIVNTVRARPRLFSCIALGVFVTALLPEAMTARPVTRALIGWNVASIAYLALAAQLIASAGEARIRTLAVRHDDGRVAVLVLVIASAVAATASIGAELSVARSLTGAPRVEHTLLALLTVATSWFFTHTMFALHYAHDYYLASQQGRPGGLQFPGETRSPDYGDFLYFALIIGTAAQTADVAITTREMRRTTVVHAVLAFFFNTALVALSINVAAGLF